MIETFDLLIISKIKKIMRQIYGSIYLNTYTRFEEVLKNEYFDVNIERISKRDFFY